MGRQEDESTMDFANLIMIGAFRAPGVREKDQKPWAMDKKV